MPAKVRKKKKRAKTKSVNTALIYTRVSSKEQVANYSLETQEERCRDFAKRQGMTVLKVFCEEGKSAKTMNRPKMNDLMEYCRKNAMDVGFIIVDRMDRFSRDVQEAAVILMELENGLRIKIRSVSENIDDTPQGRFLRTIQLAASQMDNECKSVSTSAGMHHGLQHGHWQWRPPVGYRSHYTIDGETLPMEPSDQAPHVQRAFHLMKTGNYSMAEVREILEEEGFKKSPSQISRILRNRVYTGWIKHEWLDEPVRGKHPPLITEEDFEAVQRILDGNISGKKMHQRVRSDLPLKGVLKCERCDKALTGSFPTSRGRLSDGYYHCPGNGCQSLPVKKAEEMYLKILEGLEPKDEYLELFRKVVKEVWNERIKSSEETKARIEREIEKLKERKKRLMDKHLGGTVGDEDYIEESERIRKTILERESARDRVADEVGEIDEFIEYCTDCLKNLSNQWKSGRIRVKTHLNGLIFPKGVLVENKTIRITEISPILGILSTENVEDFRLVPPAEFESASPP